MESDIITTAEAPAPRVRAPRQRTKVSPKPRKKKREDRLKSVIVRFRITPEQERSVLAEYPDVRISMLARRRLLGKRVGSPEHKDLVLKVLTGVREVEQALHALYSVLDSEAASHAFGRALAREVKRIAVVRENAHELFSSL